MGAKGIGQGFRIDVKKGVRRASRGEDAREGKKILINIGGERRPMTERGNAADREPGCRADEGGVRPLDCLADDEADSRFVDAVFAADEQQNGRAGDGATEDERFHDFRDGAAAGRRRFLGRAGGVGHDAWMNAKAKRFGRLAHARQLEAVLGHCIKIVPFFTQRMDDAGVSRDPLTWVWWMAR